MNATAEAEYVTTEMDAEKVVLRCPDGVLRHVAWWDIQHRPSKVPMGARRAIAATLAKVERAAYDRYIHAPPTVDRGGSVNASGHGSWSVGPNGPAQREWSAWSMLLRFARAALTR